MKAVLHMRAVRDLLRCTQITTGAAHVTSAVVVALPVPLPSRGKVTRMRSCSNPTHSSAKKQKTDNAEASGEQTDEQGAASSSKESSEETYTGWPPDKCSCGADFKTSGEVNMHVKIVHAKSWTCSGEVKDKKTGNMKPCGCSYPAGDRLWKHYRKIHLGIYRYMCPYKVNGEPCDKKTEERAGWLYHKEVVYKM